MRQLAEKGLLQRTLDIYKIAQQVCPDYSGKALGLNSVITAFFPLIAGAAVSILAWFYEMIWKQLKGNDSYQ